MCGVLTVNSHELPVTPVPVQALYANISLLGKYKYIYVVHVQALYTNISLLGKY